MIAQRRFLHLAFAMLSVLAALLLLSQSAAPHAFAQSGTATPVRTEQAGVIRFGVPVEGALDNTVFRQVWRFEATGGAVVDIRMQALSGDLDPLLVLISPLGDVLRTNDSANGGLDAGILAYQLPFNGEYQIIARRSGDSDGRGGRTSGTYRLTLDLRSPATAAQNTVLFIGRTVEGRLTDEQPRAVYRLELGGALALRLDLDGANRLAAVRLLTIGGALLGEYQGLSPLDVALNLPTSGTLLVEVSAPSYEERTAADFALSLYRLVARPEPPKTLRYGAVRYAEAPQTAQWFFIGTAGDVLALSVQAETFGGALDVDVTVGIPNELPLFRGVLGIGFEQVFTLPSTGAYSVELRVPSGRRFSYSVLLKQIGANSLPFERLAVLRDQGSVTFNTPISDNLPRGEVQSRWLDASADQVITVRAAPRSSADTLGVAILRPDGTILAANVSRAERGAVLQNILLPQAGRYRIAVFELALQTEREVPIAYILRVEDTDGGSLRPAEPVKGVATRANGLSIWEIRAPADSLINVRLENLMPAVWQPEMFVLNPNGVVIAAARGETSRDQTLDILGAHADESGTYRVVVGGRVIGNFATYRLVSGVQAPFEPPLAQEVAVAPLSGVGALDRYAPAPTPPPIRLSVAAQLSPLINPAELPPDQIAPLPFNTTVRGEIGSGGLVQAWRINSGSNVVIQLRATALEGTVAPRLTLWDRTGRVVGEQFNAQGAVTFFTYRIVQGGNYTVVVSLGLSGGRYLLSLDSQPLVETLRVTDGTPLTYGQTIAAELQSSLESDTYFFLGTLNDVISVQAMRVTGRLAPALSLIGPNGREIAANRPTDGRYYAELPSVRLPDSGLYRLVVSNLNQSERIEGRYTLSLGLLSATRLQSRGGGVIREGEIQSGFLLAGDNEDTWLFRARRGQRVSFVAYGAEPPAPAPLSVQLLDTSGQLFAAQTRTLSHSAVRLEDILLPDDGIYRVRVVGGTQGQGVYRLQWLPADERASGVISYGQTVSGILTAARNFETWVFSGNMGDVVSVALRYVRGTPFTASFQLRAANGVPLATVADLDGSGARADVLLPFDGSYSIIVANPMPEFQGANIYALSLGLTESRARAIGGILRYGEEALSILYADDAVDTWVFAAQAGERVRVRVQATDRFLAPYLELRSATDEVLAAALPEPLPLATARIGGEGANDFVIPIDGAYALIVRGLPTEEGVPSTGGYRIRLDFTPRPAAEIERLSYGSAVNGVLADDRPHEAYLFEGKQGNLITAQAVRESGASLSLQLQIRAADGRILAQADSDDSDSVILRNFRLPETGDYRLVVLRFGNALGQTAGRYTVRLEGVPEARPVRSQVRYGQQVLGRLNDDVPIDRIAFEGRRGDVIGITTRATSGDLDIVLRLEREDSGLIAANDDSDGVNAALNGIQLPEDGRYIVALTRIGTRTTGSAGNYELFINLLYQSGNLGAEVQPITYGSRLIGTLDAQTTERRYAFRGTQSDQIAVQMLHQNDDAPPILELRDSSGRLLGSGSLEVGRTTLEAFRLSADGLYQLVVRRPLNSRARYSPFALTLDLESISAATNGLNGGVLTAESSVIGTFAPAETAHYWLLNGIAGQTLSLNVLRLAGEGLPTVIAIAPDGQRVGETVATARSLSTTLEQLYLPQDGVYTLLVLPERVGILSSYRLTVQRAVANTETPPALVPGIAANGTLDAVRTRGLWRLEAEAGQTLSARLLVTSGNLQPRLLLLSANGRVLAEGALIRTAEGLSSLLVDYPIAQTGAYFLQTERAEATTSGNYRLLMELGSPAKVPSERALAALRVAYNQAVRGVISSQRETLWAFIGAAGDVVNISVVANTPSGGAPIPSPQLEIQDVSGRVLASAAPEALEARESAVQGLILPADGRYIVVMRTEKTVPYTLIVQRRQDSLPSNIAAAAARPLVAGLALQNGITPNSSVDYWTFTGAAGDPVQIEATRLNGDLRLDLALYAPSGAYLTGNAAAPTLSSVTLAPLCLPEDGTYLLVVTRWLGAAGRTNGAYRVRLARPAEVQVPLEGMISTDNRPAVGFLSAERTAETWRFSGRADERYELIFERATADLEARVQLLGADGQVLGEFVPYEARLAISGQFTLPNSGEYQLVARLQSGSGLYRLRLQRLQTAEQASVGRAQGIAYNQIISGVLEGGVTQAWVFYGKAADRIVAELLPEGDTLSGVTFSLLRPDGKTLATAVRFAAGSRLADIVLPSDGFYALAIRAERTAPLPYRLRLTRLQPGASYQGALTLESLVEGALRSEQMLHEWLLRPETSERLAVRLSAARGIQGVRLLVVTAEGRLIAEGALQNGSLALDFQPQADAQYAILVQNVSGVQGRYQLEVRLSRPTTD
ncbi:MAG: hypothetical protein CUN51_00630 [Candidatus Thermofonsia Clade 1 bacterium]|uniref:Peptidase C-terminal archaeal/bacterial domain-containing protein n=1 Tax=Candidatus Thermofonsia Clade 1 bacterium TaxID=2364210 RepID=A0A2M8P3N9_9CHLR|nr:MAG: hypothetical protein CUN51_00630 [Candidatus Thermofonsia Clade 1 bacterium]